MFIVLLEFSDNKPRAADFMADHNQWLQQGFTDGVFLLAGSIQPSAGGSLIAHNVSLAELQTRINSDPFVKENIVHAKILEITPSKTDNRLEFLR